MHTKTTKQEKISTKKHSTLGHGKSLNKTVHEFSSASSSWSGPNKSDKLKKDKMATSTHYVGSCGSPCNYTGLLKQ